MYYQKKNYDSKIAPKSDVYLSKGIVFRTIARFIYINQRLNYGGYREGWNET